MKKFLPFILLLVLVTGCAKIYQAPNFERATRSHKTVAILPFEVNINAKNLPKNVTQEMIKADEEQTALNAQNQVYSFFLRQLSRGNYTVEFQDIDKTNALLKKANLPDAASLTSMSKDEIAQTLGVDAVITGKLVMEKPMKDGAAIAIGVLFGIWGNTNQVFTTLTIHDGKEGKLLWKYDWTASGSVGTSTETLIRQLMRNVSKKFPYQVEKS